MANFGTIMVFKLYILLIVYICFFTIFFLSFPALFYNIYDSSKW